MGLSTNIEIFPLTPADAAEYLRLRQEALKDAPHAFLASPDDDKETSLEVARARLVSSENSTIIGARDGCLAGVVGVVQEKRPKTAHKAVIWGMYVQSAHRGKGIARQLLQAAIYFAENLKGVDAIHLTVAEPALEALSLYESCGFTIWGTEPDAIRVNGKKAV